MPPRRRSAPQDTHNEAAQLADRIQQAGYIKRDIARIINRDPSLVSQFYTRGKGAAFVTALREVLTAIETAGITELPELAAIAARHIQRRTTASGSARLRPLIAEAARRGLRLAFTVRLAKTAYAHPSGSRTDSPGIRRDVIQRADHTEERSYGSAQTGGFDAADFARRVNAAAGDVTAAVHQWLVETGRIRADAHILRLEIRTWRPANRP